MQDIEVRRYADPEAVGWAGSITPANRAWTVFVDLDGKPFVHMNESEARRPEPEDHAKV